MPDQQNAGLFVDPSQTSDGLVKDVSAGFDSIRFERVRGQNRTPLEAMLHVAEGWQLVLANTEGSMVVRPRGTTWRVVAPKTVVYASGPVDVDVWLSRGSHDAIVCTWERSAAEGLASWTDAQFAKRRKLGRLAMASFGGLHDAVHDVQGSILSLVENPEPLNEPLALSLVHYLAGHTLSAADEFSLATVPPGLPNTLVELCEKVKSAPLATWSLKEAAEFAGYSPFHLSRTFKALVGYGFPDFVDRVRTGLAVEKLFKMEGSIEEIANAAGFSTAHGLRESIKEYLGLLPSELRALVGTSIAMIGNYDRPNNN